MPHSELDYPVYYSPTDSEETAIIAARIAKQFEAHTCETDFSAPQAESLSAHYSFLNSESATLARFDFDFEQYPHAVRVAAYSAEGDSLVSEFLSAINATEAQ